MELIYVSSESTELINAMKANISSGKEATNQLKAGSQKVISAVDGRTLSGAAYTAGKGLFSDLIVPTIGKVTAAIDELETELTTYSNANSKVSSEGTLHEGRIRDKIATKKAMKQAVDASAAIAKAATRNNPAAKILDSLLHVQYTLSRMSNAFETDILELQHKLKILQQFSSETSGLFSNSLSTMKLAMQAVTILSKTIVYPDGTYQLPAGIVPDWFNQLNKQNKAETSNIDKQPDVGNREYKLIDLGYGKLWMWVEKGKTFATGEDIDVTLAYNEWVSRMIDKYGVSFLQGEHQEGFLELFIRQNATLVKELSTGVDSITGRKLTTQDKLLKMTTLANSMLTAGVVIKGVVDVGKTSGNKSNTANEKVSGAGNLKNPEIGNKLDYLFGKAKGNKHNIQRSQTMQSELSKIGIYDTPSSRELLNSHLKDVLNDPSNILKTESRSYIAKELTGQPTVNYTATVRESFLKGPHSGVKIESVWDGDRLLTIIVKGGK